MDADSSERTELPAEFADHAAAVTDLDTPPATLEEWWAATAEQYAATDVTVDFDDLYSESPTRHEVQVNGRVRYANCAMDALLAALMEEQTTVTVRSVDPVSATPVTFTVADDGLEASSEDAVICFGMNIDPADVETVGSLAEWSVQDDKDAVRDSACQYTNAFESKDTYERWASVTDCVSAPFPPETVVPLLQQLPEHT